VTHEFDVGATTPGSSSVGPTNRFEDGIDLPAMRCGADDRLFRDYTQRCLRAVRTPLFWTLDEKTRLAGCHILRGLVLELVAAEGVEVYKQFIREAVEDGRRAMVERTQEQLIPGTYRASAFIDYQFSGETALPPEAAIDCLMHAPIEITVPIAGGMTMSLSGASGWGYHSFNCTPEAVRGGLWAFLTETLLSNDKVNDGCALAVKVELPVGSWANPGHGLTSHSDSWYLLTPMCNTLARPLSRGYQARGYIEEVVSGWGDGNFLQGGAVADASEGSAISNMEPSCVGAGGGVIRDGLDYASASWFPHGDMGDVEDWESIEPLLYLGRSIKCDSAGLGRRRGGLGFESLRMVWADQYLLQNIGDGAVFCQAGLFGGYPAASGYRHNVRQPDLPQRFAERRPYPSRDGNPDTSEVSRLTSGRETLDMRATTLLERYQRYDLYLSFIRGGPGLGDPLERTAPEIERDLRARTLSERHARDVYGVVTASSGDSTISVDPVATERRRRALRTRRADRAIPVREWIDGERKRVLDQRVIEPVADMYRSSMALSPRWAAEYREFWGLPEDFTY
jgi:N-methylhydantoinase B